MSHKTIDELRASATFELDQIETSLSLAKTFSQTFDGYMSRLSDLVKTLLDTDCTDEPGHENDLVETLDHKAMFNKKFLAEDNNKKNEESKKNSCKDIFKLSGGLPAHRDLMNDFPSNRTANFNVEHAYADHLKRASIGVDRSPEPSRDDSIISALQTQSATINKVIEAGETNSRNLRDILNKLFESKEYLNVNEALNNKIVKLKTKVHKLRIDAENRDSENQKLRIDLNVTKSLKKEIETLYQNSIDKRESRRGSLSIMQASCKSCEAYKSENSLLLAQLGFTMTKMEVLSQNVESMKNEFIELYKTTQEQSQPFFYSVTKEYISNHEESQSLINDNIQQSLDSNYNTIIHKLDNLEAGIFNQNHIIIREAVNARPADFSYTSHDVTQKMNDTTFTPRCTKNIDFRYSCIAEEDLHNQIQDTSNIKPPYNDETLYNHFLAPLEQIFDQQENKTEFIDRKKIGSLKKILSEEPLDIEVPLFYNTTTASNSPNARNNRGKDVFNDSLNMDDTPKSPELYRQSEDRNSVVQLLNSNQNSLEVKDSLFKNHFNSERINALRLSFANKGEFSEGWAEMQAPKEDQAIIVECTNERDVFDNSDGSGSEDINVERPATGYTDFYTFSNRNSEQVLGEREI